MSQLPLFLGGVVCKGFGRGSKELGIPTGKKLSEEVQRWNENEKFFFFLFPSANLPESEVDKIDPSVEPGVYYGWAQVHGEIHKMVMSLGWNPFYKNIKKTAVGFLLSSTFTFFLKLTAWNSGGSCPSQVLC